MKTIDLDSLIKENIFELKDNCVYRLNDIARTKIQAIYKAQGWNEILFQEKLIKRDDRFVIIWNKKEIFNEQIQNIAPLTLAFSLTFALSPFFAFALALTLALGLAILEKKLYNDTDSVEFIDESSDKILLEKQKIWLELDD